jgi:hypothetical protein
MSNQAFHRKAYNIGGLIATNTPTENALVIATGEGGAKQLMETVQPNIFSLPTVDLTDPRTSNGYAVQGARASRSIARLYHNAPGFPHSGVISVLKPFDEYKGELAIAYSERFKPSITDGFTSENGVTGDFSKMCSCTGVKADPLALPIVGRSILFKSLNLATDFICDEHRRIFDCIHKNLMGARDDEADASFNVESSTGMPFFFGGRSDVLAKQVSFRFLLNNYERILNHVDHDDVYDLFKTYGIYNAMRIIERQQPDGLIDLLGGDLASKPRFVADIEYALSGGKKGQMIKADKEFITRGIFGLKYGVAMRVRTAYAVNGQINFLITALMSQIRAVYFKKYAYTYHHTTPDAIYDKIAGVGAVVGADMTTMDQLVPSMVLDRHAELMGQYYDPRLTKLLRWFNGMPAFALSTGIGRDPLWIGDPRDPRTFVQDMGLTSGRADNPDLGKLWGTFVYYICLFNVIPEMMDGYSSLSACIDDMMLGKHPIAFILNMGDDVVFCIRERYAHYGAILRTAFETKSPLVRQYADLAAELGVAFLGNVFWRDEAGKIGVPKPNPITYSSNLHAPEHSVNSSARPYWALGRLEALNHYSRAGSIITEMNEMSDECWRKHLPNFPTPLQQAKHVIKISPQPPLVTELSSADCEVLLNPAKLYYKFTPEDISPEIVSMFTSKIEAPFITKSLKFMRN